MQIYLAEKVKCKALLFFNIDVVVIVFEICGGFVIDVIVIIIIIIFISYYFVMLL